MLLPEQPGAGSAEFLQGEEGDGLSNQPEGDRQAATLVAAGAQLKVAWVLAGAGADLPQPRAKYRA